MDTDDSTTIDSPEDVAWVAQQRQKVVEYLALQGCEHKGVSQEPRWFVSPYVAVWAVRSKANPDQVGWWAISGDLPTDHITAGDQTSTGDVLIAFAKLWRAASERMRDGKQLAGYTLGNPSRAKELAPLLQSRADLLQKWGEEFNRSEA